jgi:hypothetical protein
MFRKEFLYRYDGRDIPYSVWVSDESTTINTIIFLGTVQIENLPKWVTEACPPRTAVVQGAPHWFAKEDGSDIPEYMFGYTEDAFRSIAETFRFENLSIIAESQAAPGVIQLFANKKYTPYNVKNIVLLQPLGFNVNSFCGTDTDRMDAFKKRIIKNSYHQLADLFLDSRLRYNHKLLNKTVQFNDSSTQAQYNSGLKWDSLPDARKLILMNQNVTIVCGEKDKIFMPSEIKGNLEKANIPIRVVMMKGIPHSPIATRKGLVLLEKAFALIGTKLPK